MIHTLQQLEGLLARVQVATGGEYRLVWEVYRAAPIEWKGGDVQRRAFEQVLQRYTDAKAFTEAALTLVERVFPGWSYSMGRYGGKHISDLWMPPKTHKDWVDDKTYWPVNASERHRSFGANDSLAILAALITALIAQEAGDAGQN